MVTNERLQHKMAEVQEWAGFRLMNRNLQGISPGKTHETEVPNWPTDSAAAYNLPGIISDRFIDCLALTMNVIEGDLDYPPYARNGLVYVSSKYPTMCPTPQQWCLAWLLSEHGLRWVDCDSCEGEPHGHSEDCTDCSGDGGKWEKV